MNVYRLLNVVIFLQVQMFVFTMDLISHDSPSIISARLNLPEKMLGSSY